ncbi:luciferase-type oxidoreductase [compost metagenome]
MPGKWRFANTHWEYFHVLAGLFVRSSRSGSRCYIELAADPATPSTPIHLGFRLGCTAQLSALDQLHSFGVNHVMIQLKYGQRPVSEVLAELCEWALPQYPALA